MDSGLTFLTGRLTRDPLFFGEGDVKRAIFTIAFNRGRDDKRKTTFVQCIAWGKRADIMRDFSKGSGIHVSGELELDSYTNKDDVKIERLQVNVNIITATQNLRRRAPQEVGAEAGGPDVTIGGDGNDGDNEDSAVIPF